MRNAVDAATAFDDVEGVHLENVAAGEAIGQHGAGFLVVQVVERGHDDAAIGQIEIHIRRRQRTAARVQPRFLRLRQLDHLDGFIAARKRNFAALKSGLADLQHLLALPEATANSDPAWFGFPITVAADAPFTRNALTQRLEARRIGTRLLFGGNLVRQPYMIGRDFRVAGDLPVADAIMERTFWIGVYPGLSPDHIAYMLEVIHDFCANPS